MLVEAESKLVTCVTAYDPQTSWPLLAMVPHKGHSDYLVRRREAYVTALEHAKVILQGDGEGAIRTVVNAVAKSLGSDKAQVRFPPREPWGNRGNECVPGWPDGHG